MKRFESFGEYMFDLLFGPLKRGKRTANQFFIFFKVIGRLFDETKKDIFRVRDEANIASASSVMLSVHDQDRGMPRLKGEDVEAYRTRLSMKGIISEWGGTKTGILYALTALNYDQSSIEPAFLEHPEHWAEFIVHLKSSKLSSVDNLDIIITEINKVKEGSSKLYKIQMESTPMPTTLYYAGAAASHSRTELPEWQMDQSFTIAINIAGGFGTRSRTELLPVK